MRPDPPAPSGTNCTNRSNPPLLSLAFYLPQFHTIPENDAWWGSGFTEWVKLNAARQWTADHAIRRPVAPLGEYDLRSSATMEAQYRLAVESGVDGFLVWDYWLGNGRMLLSDPIQRVLDEQLRFRYALAWANHDWLDRSRGRVLAKQYYLGQSDYIAYFQRCLPHFRSAQYIRVADRPLFFIYRPDHVPDLDTFIHTWQELAKKSGLSPIFFVGDLLSEQSRARESLDAYSHANGFWKSRRKFPLKLAIDKLRGKVGLKKSPQTFPFRAMASHFMPDRPSDRFVPTVYTGWDTTPRHGANGVLLRGFNPDAFLQHLECTLPHLLRPTSNQRLLFVKSWNEWAEGNLIEPDSVFGSSLLQTFHRFVSETRRLLTDVEASRCAPTSPRQSDRG